MKAYVLIQTEAGGGPLAEQLRAIPGVLAADDLSGAFDAIALARSGSTQRLTESVMAEIRRLPGVTRVLPAPVTHSLTEPGTRPFVRQGSARDEAA